MTTKINKSHLILLKIIERDGNKYCADCGSEGTRWASWNFGIFLCIRCAGIHRNLGVHISKVKSVDLDSWTSEQLQVMELIGNKKSQKKYEAALPDNFVRPQTNYAIEEFIRSKYQYKRYCSGSPTTAVPSTTLENGENKTSTAPTKKLVSFETENDNESNPIKESDDSLSEPEYLMELKEKPRKTYHKVHSEGDLISFNYNAKSVPVKKDLMDVDNKTRILSLYDQSKANGGYQSSLPQNANVSYHKSYGSSTDGQLHSTTSIPASNQNSYLKQIQDKLTNIKGNLTSKFKSYEQPDSSYHSNDVYSQGNRGVSNTNNAAINQIGGQTLSPDLWR